MTTQPSNDPIVIGFEQAQAAARALGITDLMDLREIHISPDKVRVARVVRDEHGGVQYRPDSFEVETTETTIPVVYDDDAAEAVRAGGVR